MMPARTLAQFLICLVAIELALIIPWPGWPGVYRSTFVSAGNLLIDGMFFRSTSIKVQPNSSPHTVMDIEVIATNRAAGQRATIPMSSRHMGWMAMAFGLALALATPAPWRLRTLAVGWMLLGTSALALVRAWVSIVVNISNPEGPSLLQLASPVRATVFGIDSVLSVPMFGWYVAPLLIWLAWLIIWGWSGIISQGEHDKTERNKR